MSTTEHLDATALARCLTSGEVTALSVTRETLARIDELDAELNAFLTVDIAGALAAAQKLDEARAQGLACGPLHGLPVAIKDVTPTRGLRTTQGSTLFAEHIPDHDAESVSRLRRAGAVIIGKTNTPEFAFGAVCTNKLKGPTRNPWDRTRTSGGSSGGSAVAVATGMAALAQGTDFGGSVRMPASFCGIVGLRPTPGRIPDPDRSLGWASLSTQGILARSVRDAELMLGVMSGPHDGDPLSIQVLKHDAAGSRIAASLDLGGAFPVDSEVAKAFHHALEAARDVLGPIAAAHPDMTDGVAAFKRLRAAESWFRSGALVDAHENQLSPSFVWNVRQGKAIRAEEYLEAEAVRTALWRRALAFFANHDILIMPSCAIMPFLNDQSEVLEVGGTRLDSIIDYLACTFLISLIGFPALSLPAPRKPHELPFGIQLVAAPGREATLFRVAKVLEAAGFRQVWSAEAVT